jgi:hypothetical protein
MSTITKVAVYDSRLIQDEPVYAVQKGALSVSVAPFQAISANSSQMTFQVLVPSLNVFVDRKIQLSATLNFTAQLFYGGPRGQSIVGLAGGAWGGTACIKGTALTISAMPTINGVVPGSLPVGTLLYSSNAAYSVASGTMITGVNGALSYTVNIAQNWGIASPGSTGMQFLTPAQFDVPDVSTSVQQQIATDGGLVGANASDFFQPLGFATAVSSKDLALVSFPIQSALTNMTATLNDCTVTTNGDTLREQILLTSSQETLKQRTCPSNQDVYSWGRDDMMNGSGNFSSYSVVNGYGDLPNGSFPIQWASDASQNSALGSTTTVYSSGAAGAYPFLPPGSVYSFGLNNGGVGNISAQGGCGWYIATQASNVTGASKNNVLVPFVNGQPVWTTGFPGGDLISLWNSYTTPVTAASATERYDPPAGFRVISGTVIELLKSVPPYCMIGARVYRSGATPGTAVTSVGFVSHLLTGALGIAGSTYYVCAPTALSIATLAGDAASNLPGSYQLQAGFQGIYGPMPVFGAINVVEPLVISPLIWADSAEFQSVGLYGMTNMQFVMNFGALGSCAAALNGAPTLSDITGDGTSTVPFWVDDLTKNTNNTGNILRSSNVHTVISDLAFSSSTNQYGPWTSPTLFVEFLTPGPDVTLPLVSTVPYVEFPRYQTTTTVAGLAKDTSISTNTISLTSIPDMIMMYVKPGTKGPSQLDQYIPIQGVSVTFDNFSNLCSGFQQFNLYESAVAAGLDMDWHQWRGYTQAAYPSLARTTVGSALVTTKALYKMTGFTQLSGGPVLLRMGQDITLSPGLAPGCLGNYSFQAQLRVSNPWGYYDYVSSIQTTVIAINTGFFETVRGQSAIRKTILNSADVEAAGSDVGITKTHLSRMIGRGGRSYMHGSNTAVGLAHAASKALRRIAKEATGPAFGGRPGAILEAGVKRARSSGLL